MWCLPSFFLGKLQALITSNTLSGPFSLSLLWDALPVSFLLFTSFPPPAPLLICLFCCLICHRGFSLIFLKCVSDSAFLPFLFGLFKTCRVRKSHLPFLTLHFLFGALECWEPRPLPGRSGRLLPGAPTLGGSVAWLKMLPSREIWVWLCHLSMGPKTFNYNPGFRLFRSCKQY